VNGAEDPVSGWWMRWGSRSLGELLKLGWKPHRTIIYCVWDGEEEGLLGSTEWVRRMRMSFASMRRSTSTRIRTGAATSLPAARTRWRNHEWRGARH